MKVWYFILYALYLLFGCFTIAFILTELNIESQAIGFILCGVWGFIIAKDAMSRFN
jgi:hypothetical protein